MSFMPKSPEGKICLRPHNKLIVFMGYVEWGNTEDISSKIRNKTWVLILISRESTKARKKHY